MPLQPLTVTLTDGQKLDVLKRFRKLYSDELAQVETQMTEILTAIAEADHLGQFLGDQPEVRALKAKQSELAALEQRRTYLGKLLDRLEAVTPAQADVKVPLPSGGAPPRRGGAMPPPPGGSAGGQLRRF
jgi:hypothetical protein